MGLHRAEAGWSRSKFINDGVGQLSEESVRRKDGAVSLTEGSNRWQQELDR